MSEAPVTFDPPASAVDVAAAPATLAPKRAPRLPWALLAFAALGALLPLMVASQLLMTLLAQAVFSALLATAVGVLIRLNGMVSFGHAAFFGVAGYTVALSLKHQWMAAELARQI